MCSVLWLVTVQIPKETLHRIKPFGHKNFSLVIKKNPPSQVLYFTRTQTQPIKDSLLKCMSEKRVSLFCILSVCLYRATACSYVSSNLSRVCAEVKTSQRYTHARALKLIHSVIVVKGHLAECHNWVYTLRMTKKTSNETLQLLNHHKQHIIQPLFRQVTWQATAQQHAGGTNNSKKINKKCAPCVWQHKSLHSILGHLCLCYGYKEKIAAHSAEHNDNESYSVEQTSRDWLSVSSWGRKWASCQQQRT